MALVLKQTEKTVPVAESKPESKKKPKETGKPVSGNLMEVLAGIRKDKGDKVVVPGNKVPVVRRLPTGIFELDFYLGGGFPCGRYSIVYGPESSNKTNLCWRAAANAQRLPEPCNKVIYVNVEQSFDPVWAEKMGVDVNKLLVVQAGYGEEACDLVDALVRAEDVALVIVDSVAGLIASKEIANSIETYDIGTSALLIKRMVNKLMIAFCEEQKRDHDPCVILINQTRFKPGVMFGDPETMPGGEAQKFLSSLRIRCYAKNVIDKATNTVTFKDTKVIVKKAKVPVRAASFDFSLCVHPTDYLSIGETDSFNMVKSHLQALGLLEKAKNDYVLNDGSKKGQVFQTLGAISDKYYADKKFQLALQGLVLSQYQDKGMILVEEQDFSPKDIKPGDVQPIANGDTNE